MAENSSGFVLRKASPADIPVLLRLIKELADYEKLLDEVVVTEETLKEWLFGKGSAEALICEVGEETAGYALFFHNFSTFLGRAGIYIEDIYVRPAFRGRGLGKAMFSRVAELAVSEGCGRLEWACLDWNKPSIGFYRSLGALPQEDWTVYRLAGDALRALAQGK